MEFTASLYCLKHYFAKYNYKLHYDNFVFLGLGDSKTWIRSASISCINAWGGEAGYKEFFDGEMISDALKTGSPTLRTELWAWLAEKLPDIKPKSFPREELISIIPHLYSNLEDRSADVRKNAQEAVLGVMLHLGYESMLKQTEKLKVCIFHFSQLLCRLSRALLATVLYSISCIFMKFPSVIICIIGFCP